MAIYYHGLLDHAGNFYCFYGFLGRLWAGKSVARCVWMHFTGKSALDYLRPCSFALSLKENQPIQRWCFRDRAARELEIQPYETVPPFCRADKPGLWILRPESQRPWDTVGSKRLRIHEGPALSTGNGARSKAISEFSPAGECQRTIDARQNSLCRRARLSAQRQRSSRPDVENG